MSTLRMKAKMKIKKVWHPWTAWECYPGGFYSTVQPVGMDKQQAKEAYKNFLADINLFESCMARVAEEWPRSCEHFLTNEQINRVAWLGQSAMCIHTKVSSAFCGGFKLLEPWQQRAANKAASRFLTRWLSEYKDKTVQADMAGQGLSPGHTRRSADGAYARQPGAVLQGNLFCDTQE